MAKSFIEILEAQIRNDLKTEIAEEIRREMGVDVTKRRESTKATAMFESLGVWMAANVNPTASSTASSTRAKSPYQSVAKPKQNAHAPKQDEPKAAPLAPEFGFEVRTSNDAIANELLARIAGETASQTLTETKIKTMWRKAALKTHPDRFASADKLTQTRKANEFRDLAQAYEQLMTTLRMEKDSLKNARAQAA